jgi:hypothetical protein
MRETIAIWRGSMTGRHALKMLVGIPTIGRAAILRATLGMITRQTRPPDGIYVAPASDADVAGIDLAALGGTRILAAAGDYDTIVFFDDDFFPCKDYLAAVERALLEEDDIVMTTGTVIADAASRPELAVEAARRMIEDAEHGKQASGPRQPTYNAYGCNMAFRLDATRRGVVFDEALPLYSWLEDVDFSRRLAPYGRIVKLADALHGQEGHFLVAAGRQADGTQHRDEPDAKCRA